MDNDIDIEIYLFVAFLTFITMVSFKFLNGGRWSKDTQSSSRDRHNGGGGGTSSSQRDLCEVSGPRSFSSVRLSQPPVPSSVSLRYLSVVSASQKKNRSVGNDRSTSKARVSFIRTAEELAPEPINHHASTRLAKPMEKLRSADTVDPYTLGDLSRLFRYFLHR